MITHIVLFKLKDRSPEVLRRIKDSLEGLKGRVKEIREIEAGIDVLGSPRSFDLALTVRFDSLKDLEAYQKHPLHAEVADYIATVRESIVAVDYES